MDWYFFKSYYDKHRYQSNQGRWFFKHPKSRPDSVFSPHRQLEDLWSQVCTLGFASIVGIHVPEVFLVIPVYWDNKLIDQDHNIHIRASLFSKELNPFTELSSFYKTLIKTQKPSELYEKPQLYLDLLNAEQKTALGQLYAVALWLGHWDIANNIDFANSGFTGSSQSVPAIVDGGNALDEGFHGYRKLQTISLFATYERENNFQTNQKRDFESLRFGYDHLSPFNHQVYPFLPRFLFDQKKFFWSDPIVVQGFISQSNVIGKVTEFDLKENLRQNWRHVVSPEGLHNAKSVATLKAALKMTKSRWSQNPKIEILSDLLKRGRSLNKLAKQISLVHQKDPSAVLAILDDQLAMRSRFSQ